MYRPVIPKLYPGFQIVFDNLNIGKKAHAKTVCRNKHLDLVHGYAILDSANVEYMDDSGPMDDILTKPNSSFILSKGEHRQIRDTLKILVQRCMVEYLPFFREHCATFVVKHIPHPHEDSMAQKSVIVSTTLSFI